MCESEALEALARLRRSVTHLVLGVERIADNEKPDMYAELMREIETVRNEVCNLRARVRDLGGVP